MNYNQILYYDTGNSHGISTTLFVQGCANGCLECHNPQTWDFNGGYYFSKKEKDNIKNSLKNPHVKYFVLSGGDPFNPRNVEDCFNLLKEIRELNCCKIICYTGYELIELLHRKERYTEGMLSCIDYLIDGPFVLTQRPKKLELRGSLNQHCYKISYDKDFELIISRYDEYFYLNGDDVFGGEI